MIAGRHELKYYVTPRQCDRLLTWLRPHVEQDKWIPRGKTQYTVRSIYFDSQDLDFYFEKLDGVKIRKKLRIRGYGSRSSSDKVFLEIKRKYGNRVVKERTPLKFIHVEPILDSYRPHEILPSASFRDLQVIGKFLHTLRSKPLRPIVLVIYERQALVGCDDDDIRVTFDRDIRCVFRPTLDELFSDSDSITALRSVVILELKFTGPMPGWLRRMVWEFRLRPQAISKYCMCIDACCNGDWTVLRPVRMQEMAAFSLRLPASWICSVEQGSISLIPYISRPIKSTMPITAASNRKPN